MSRRQSAASAARHPLESRRTSRWALAVRFASRRRPQGDADRPQRRRVQHHDLRALAHTPSARGDQLLTPVEDPTPTVCPAGSRRPGAGLRKPSWEEVSTNTINAGVCHRARVGCASLTAPARSNATFRGSSREKVLSSASPRLLTDWPLRSTFSAPGPAEDPRRDRGHRAAAPPLGGPGRPHRRSGCWRGARSSAWGPCSARIQLHKSVMAVPVASARRCSKLRCGMECDRGKAPGSGCIVGNGARIGARHLNRLVLGADAGSGLQPSAPRIRRLRSAWERFVIGMDLGTNSGGASARAGTSNREPTLARKVGGAHRAHWQSGASVRLTAAGRSGVVPAHRASSPAVRHVAASLNLPGWA
jgi:hypothetical protein